MTLVRTMLEKIWSTHVVANGPGTYDLLYIDRHLLHEGSRAAFVRLAKRGMSVRRPDLCVATADHYVGTAPRRPMSEEGEISRIVASLAEHTSRTSIVYFGPGKPERGIVHVIGGEQGLTLPGTTIACGDSHTATHGALGALAFGIGSSEVEHVLATQTLWMRKPRLMRVSINGELGPGVTAKDVILFIIANIGSSGALNHAIEYAGTTVRTMTVDERATICNMSVEAGARTGLIAPDDVAFAYLKGRTFAPANQDWEQAVAQWKTLPSDPGAIFEKDLSFKANGIVPMVSWGTSPQDSSPITGAVPDPDLESDPARREALRRSLSYMGLAPSTPLQGLRIDRVFIGSCTNGRLDDLRSAARVVKGRRAVVPAWVVPGSGPVKRAAEAEGLDQVFTAAGFEWREPGCSMCVGMNGEIARPGERIASTTNRNFEGRQGKGARTHLMSPAMAAAAAVNGRLTDPRNYL